MPPAGVEKEGAEKEGAEPPCSVSGGAREDAVARVAQAFREAAVRLRGAGEGEDEAWIVALSGGLDSVTLLELCARFREDEAPGLRLLAAHLHHGLRGAEADADAAFCRDLCARRGVAFRESAVDVAARAAEEGSGLEAAGRAARHAFLSALAAEERPARVLLAHHADDQAETVLLRLLRGCHLRGAGGMRGSVTLEAPPLRIERPLLRLARGDLHAYATAEGLVWREDASNRDPRFLRNRLRHELVPVLDRIEPAWRDALLAFAGGMRMLDEPLRAEARRLRPRHERREADGVVLRDLAELPAYLLGPLFEEVLAALGGPAPDGAAHRRLLRLARSDPPGRSVCLPGGWRARRESDGVVLFPPPAASGGEEGAQGGTPAVAGDAEEREVRLPETIPFRFEALGVVVDARWVEVPPDGLPLPADRAAPEVEWLAEETLRPPLVLRVRRPGDRMRPLGAPGRRRLKEILIDRRVPRRRREAVRCLADAAGLLWAWPVALAERARVGPGTRRALRVEMRGAEGLHENRI